MPHVHSMTIFDVDRIEITFDTGCNSYVVKLTEDDGDRATQINIWRDSAGGKPAALIVEGVDFTATVAAGAVKRESAT